MKRLFSNTKLAFLTSIFILISIIYSVIVKEPIYKVSNFLFQATSIVAIVTISIHINALSENKEQKKWILLSLIVPIGVIVYSVISVIYWIKTGA